MLSKLLPKASGKETTHDTKSDPRVKRTRHLLQQALIDLLKEQEFHSITVQDITARAEVNRATFYAHFEDKYALLNYMGQNMLQSMLASKLPTAPTFSLPTLRVLIQVACECLVGSGNHCSPAFEHDAHVHMMAQIQTSLFEVILAWVKQSQPDKMPSDMPSDASLESIALMTSWVIFGAACQWARGDHKQSTEQLADQVLPLLASGVRPYLI